MMLLAIAIGILILRRERPDLKRPFKAWLPAVYIRILVCLVLLAAPFFPPVDGKGDVSFFYATYAIVGVGMYVPIFIPRLVPTCLVADALKLALRCIILVCMDRLPSAQTWIQVGGKGRGPRGWNDNYKACAHRYLMAKIYELRGICIGLAGDLRAMHRRLLIEAFLDGQHNIYLGVQFPVGRTGQGIYTFSSRYIRTIQVTHLQGHNCVFTSAYCWPEAAPLVQMHHRLSRFS